MANGSTSSMNRMKILTDKMKTSPGGEVKYDAAGYAINQSDKSIEELTKGTTVLPTANVEAKGDRYAKSIKTGKLKQRFTQIGYKKGENPNNPPSKGPYYPFKDKKGYDQNAKMEAYQSKLQNQPIVKKETKTKPTGAGGAKIGTSTHYANMADQFVHDYDSILKKDGFSMFDTKMKTHYMKQGMDYRQKASDEFDADFNKWSSDTTSKIKRPNKSDY